MMAVFKKVVADLVVLNIVLLSLSSCCSARVIRTRDVSKDLEQRELEMAVKELYAKLMEDDIESIPTTTFKQQPDTDLYIQHIVNCYKSYQFVTKQGLSERDDIYNIVNVQCMADPEVIRIVKLLTNYRFAENGEIGEYQSGHQFIKKKEEPIRQG